jgi:hypothetical protein
MSALAGVASNCGVFDEAHCYSLAAFSINFLIAHV